MSKETTLSPDDLARKVSRQAIYQRQLPARFYKNVDIVEKPQGFVLELDAKPIRTPMKNLFFMPTHILARGVAEEWEAQKDHIDPDIMPLTRLSNTAIDRVAPRRKEIIDEITEYAGSDLLCYRAADPQELAARQAERWDPVLRWLSEETGVKLVVVNGVMHQPQPTDALNAFAKSLDGDDDFTLTGLHNIMTLSGSAVLALALARAHLSIDEAWLLMHLDEDWQIEFWGEDEEARARKALRFNEFEATHQFIKLAMAGKRTV